MSRRPTSKSRVEPGGSRLAHVLEVGAKQPKVRTMSIGLQPPKSDNWLDDYTAQLQKEDKDLKAELEKYKKQFNDFHQATKVANEREVETFKKNIAEKEKELAKAEKDEKVWREAMKKAKNQASELAKELEDVQKKNANNNDEKTNKLEKELKAANADLVKAQDKANEHAKVIAQAKKTLDDEIKRNKALLDAMKQANKSLAEKFPKQK
jgi:DNA repair exonuclease SbcCD ATPase subunit